MRKQTLLNFTMLAVGAALGIIGGILLAPTSGTHTREALASPLRKLRTKVQDIMRELSVISPQDLSDNQAKLASQAVIDKTVCRAQQLLHEADELAAQLEA
ncbi:MAG: YtxH domain-containing protein [Bacteroidota bacterium]